MKNKNYYLFLDDERFPANVTWIDLPLYEWTIVRNYDQFVKCILTLGIPAAISFDHDIDQEHYQEYFRAKDEGRNIDYPSLKEKTGYECAKWLANYCIDNGIPLPLYYVHTRNGPGAANIFSVLESARKVINDSVLSRDTTTDEIQVQALIESCDEDSILGQALRAE